MWKLMKLEWKKNNMKKYVGKAAVVTVIIFLMIFATSGELNEVETVEIYGKSMIGAGVDMFANMAFMLCTAVMLSSLIISAYQNKTMNLMFSYPIKRKKIVLSQMAAVWIFNMTAMIASKLLIYAVLLLVRPYLGISAADITFGALSFWLDILLRSAAMVSIAYIALPVGLKMRSSKATIVTAVIIVRFTQGNIGSVSLVNNIPFYGVLFVLSAVSVYLSVYNVERKDLL